MQGIDIKPFLALHVGIHNILGTHRRKRLHFIKLFMYGSNYKNHQLRQQVKINR